MKKSLVVLAPIMLLAMILMAYVGSRTAKLVVEYNAAAKSNIEKVKQACGDQVQVTDVHEADFWNDPAATFQVAGKLFQTVDTWDMTVKVEPGIIWVEFFKEVEGGATSKPAPVQSQGGFTCHQIGEKVFTTTF